MQESSSRHHCMCVSVEKRRREDERGKRCECVAAGKKRRPGARTAALSLSLFLSSSSSSFFLPCRRHPKERTHTHSQYRTNSTRRSRRARALAQHASPKQKPSPSLSERERRERELVSLPRHPENKKPPQTRGPPFLHKRFSFLPTKTKTASLPSRTTVPFGRPRSHPKMQRKAPLCALVRKKKRKRTNQNPRRFEVAALSRAGARRDLRARAGGACSGDP